MITPIPNSGSLADLDRFVEYNTCHSAQDGKFCSGGGGSDAHGFSQGKGRRGSFDISSSRAEQRAFIRDSPGATTQHRGFTIRKESDGTFSARHPTYRAARPTGATLGDVKTQINMFKTGATNAARRATLKATPETTAGVRRQNLPSSATSKTGGRQNLNVTSDAFGFAQGKPTAIRKEHAKLSKAHNDALDAKFGKSYATSHRGVEIHTLPGYMTPYYYAKHPALGSREHSMSLRRVKNQINALLDKGETPRKKASARYQRRKAYNAQRFG